MEYSLVCVQLLVKSLYLPDFFFFLMITQGKSHRENTSQNALSSLIRGR